MTPLVIDNFAGGGGASTGIEAAIGRAVDHAINHDPEALAMHAANHPATRHWCQSIMAVDPMDVTGGAPVDLVWFSPDCKHHSKAKGGKPREKNIRDLAWVVVHWAERLRKKTPDGRGAPRVIMLENVEEFRHWGPLDAAGRPIPERKGEEFDLWVRMLRRQGYRVEWRELRACDYGTPTSRKRLFLVARRDGERIVWPEPTHGKPDSAEVATGARRPWRTAAQCIDWSIPCASIFGRARPLAPSTLRRIAHGVMRFVVDAPRPFIVPVTNSGWSPTRTVDADAPMPTITTARGGEYAAVDVEVAPITTAVLGRVAHGDDGRHRCHAFGEPIGTITASPEFAAIGATLAHIGNGERKGQAPRAMDIQRPLGTVVAGGCKHALVTAFLSAQYTSNTNGGRGRPDLPLATGMAGGTHHALVCAHVEQANTGRVGRQASAPLSTIVGRGTTQRLVTTTLVEADALPPAQLARAVEVAAFLIKYYGNEGGGHAIDEPLGTVTTKERFAVVAVTIDAATYVLVDIGMRMLTPRELARAQGFPDSYILEAPGPNGKPLTKTSQIAKIGNSVCPQLAEALVRANLPCACADAPADGQAVAA